MRLGAFVVILFCVVQASAGKSNVRMQTERTLAGEWIVVSSPINGQTTSPKGVTLGFPDRDMVFEQQGDLRTGVVLREDVDHLATGESAATSSVQRFSCGVLKRTDPAVP